MRKKTETSEKKYDDTPAFRELQTAQWRLANTQQHLNDYLEDVARAQKSLTKCEEDVAYWRKIVEAENGTEG